MINVLNISTIHNAFGPVSQINLDWTMFHLSGLTLLSFTLVSSPLTFSEVAIKSTIWIYTLIRTLRVRFSSYQCPVL